MEIQHESNLRIDKWLWAVRLFKTRSQASEACKKGKIIIDGVKVKPSRIIKKDEIIEIYNAPITYSYKILGLLGKRQSAKIVVDFVEDVTPIEEKLKLELAKNAGPAIYREKGQGRPTKRDRRILGDFLEN